ncbi:hypothetical protein GCM10007320_19340 [Pseudorhodoferax aquiterrae]|uniref:Alpha/beta hydrolase n=1 Tax=Pseudorhodoferax aquiterrae TaxID=747304 RepID=A0ABQ3G0P5_9BURK|nr:alpha/beta hydrolase [Pseudorhodoferax aquiterrae]GHC78685.1 hypothetical protein GCM10007320_19340 [Pseudorhodoferax aquiterrae]
MLLFSNRRTDAQTNEVFLTSFSPGSERLSLASVQKKGKGWAFGNVDDDVDDNDAAHALHPLFTADKPVLVYVHGNNNTPLDAVRRCALLEQLYDVNVVAFSWPSEGYLPDGKPLPHAGDAADGDESDLKSVTGSNRKTASVQGKIARYHQAKTNALDSTDAFARFLRMVGGVRLLANRQPFSLAAHSLGAHLFQYTLALPGANEAAGTAHNIALLAACVRASGHKDWVAAVKPKGQFFIAYNKGDSVLFGASVADGMQTKLGAEPGVDRHRAPHMRYVSFTNSQAGLGGHRYFALEKMDKRHRTLFNRIFRSEADIQASEYPRQVYAVGCDPDMLTCYMGQPEHTGGEV